VRERPYRGADVARCWAGFASIGAGLVHVAVIREHWAEWALAGAFFAVVAAGQLGWGVAALAGSRLPAPRAVAGSALGLIVLWGASRTAGLPFGPDAGQPEAVGAADLGCAALELLVAASVAAAVWARRPRLSSRGLLAGLAGGALVVGLVATPALAGTEAGGQAHHHGAGVHLHDG
jgi:hypothetical protein